MATHGVRKYAGFDPCGGPATENSCVLHQHCPNCSASAGKELEHRRAGDDASCLPCMVLRGPDAVPGKRHIGCERGRMSVGVRPVAVSAPGHSRFPSIAGASGHGDDQGGTPATGSSPSVSAGHEHSLGPEGARRSSACLSPLRPTPARQRSAALRHVAVLSRAHLLPRGPHLLHPGPTSSGSR
jgi:hypothetical protein